jgi:pilus assembly protein Flp/PilA
MLEFFRNVFAKRDDDGASAVEYGLLVAAIAALIVIVVFALGGIVKNAFKNTCDAMANNGSGSAASCAN